MNTGWTVPRVRALVLPLACAAMLTLLGGCLDRNEKKGGETLTLHGSVDIREVQLAFQDSGRIANILVDEGASVRKGQVVAELDPARYRLEVARLAGELAAQSQLVARLHQGSRPQEVEKAKAAVAAATANLDEANLLLSRKQSLLVTNRISRQEVDTAATHVRTAEAALRTAREEASLAVEGPRKEDVAAAEASLTSLQAAKDLAEQRLADTRLLAPADGVIRNRILEPGAMAAAGASVLTLALIDPLWVRAYVSEPDLGRVREGMRAELRTDTHPDKVYRGWVGFISPTAEFTPKTVETTELRTKLVYRARVFVCDPGHELRLGMPVSVTLDTAQAATPLPASPCEEGRR